jgi:hypothetical protein
MKLYELPAAFAEAEMMLTDDGELTPEAFEKFESLKIALESKIEGCCRLMRHFDAQGASYKAEADRLTHHRTVAENNAKRLKEYMKTTLDTLGIKKVETELFKVRIQNNPLAVNVDDSVNAEQLPDEFKVVEYRPNKKAMLEASKDGKALPEGCSVTQGSHLRVS